MGNLLSTIKKSMKKPANCPAGLLTLRRNFLHARAFCGKQMIVELLALRNEELRSVRSSVALFLPTWPIYDLLLPPSQR